MYFFNRRPRGFHHTFRFSSEQGDILDRLRNGMSPEDVTRLSLAEPERPYRQRHNSPLRLLGVLLMIAFLLIAIMLLLVL